MIKKFVFRTKDHAPLLVGEEFAPPSTPLPGVSLDTTTPTLPFIPKTAGNAKRKIPTLKHLIVHAYPTRWRSALMMKGKVMPPIGAPVWRRADARARR